ncbi:uncharacterized protein LOC128884873 [Hylaeus volcanicus]|uniref:uncharacterized protein LOC128884873 n=1 Tax=Hylaeus volcanicus TaxID=313075 RepID=UPI0023B84EA8|nr:uncharacterized protein LOC128884873 [Hylaeus volcanicus]
MKNSQIKFCLPVVLAILVLATLHSIEYVAAERVCRPENCFDSSMCELVQAGGQCPQSTDTCCSVVKKEHRTHCHQHGGECMDSCNKKLQNLVSDCPADKVCCTLV